MQLSIDNVGTIIAHLIPGIVAMLGVSYFSPTVRRWLGKASDEGPTFGGALLFILAALGAGLTSDAVRTHTIDEVHHRTGVDQPVWSFSQFDEAGFKKFEGIVENYFRYHQFYGNMFICLGFAYAAGQVSRRVWPWPPGWRELGIVTILVVMWLGSRSDLDACYRAIEELLPSQ